MLKDSLTESVGYFHAVERSDQLAGIDFGRFFEELVLLFVQTKSFKSLLLIGHEREPNEFVRALNLNVYNESRFYWVRGEDDLELLLLKPASFDLESNVEPIRGPDLRRLYSMKFDCSDSDQDHRMLLKILKLCAVFPPQVFIGIIPEFSDDVDDEEILVTIMFDGYSLAVNLSKDGKILRKRKWDDSLNF